MYFVFYLCQLIYYSVELFLFNRIYCCLSTIRVLVKAYSFRGYDDAMWKLKIDILFSYYVLGGMATIILFKELHGMILVVPYTSVPIPHFYTFFLNMNAELKLQILTTQVP